MFNSNINISSQYYSLGQNLNPSQNQNLIHLNIPRVNGSAEPTPEQTLDTRQAEQSKEAGHTAKKTAINMNKIYNFLQNAKQTGAENQLSPELLALFKQFVQQLFTKASLDHDELEILLKCVIAIYKIEPDAPDIIEGTVKVSQQHINRLLESWHPEKAYQNNPIVQIAQLIQALQKLTPYANSLDELIQLLYFDITLTIAEKLDHDSFHTLKYLDSIRYLYRLLETIPPEKISKEKALALRKAETRLIARLTADIAVRKIGEIEQIIATFEALPLVGSLRLHLNDFRFILAGKYTDPRLVPMNYQKAFNLYLSLTNQNHLGAQYKLGIMYIYGQGTLPNPRIGYAHLKAAAEMGHPNAISWMISQARKQNDLIAQMTLGRIYQEGVTQAPNIDKAIEYYQMAEDQKENEASLALGKIYLSQTNPTEALRHFALGSDRGNLECHRTLGDLYYNGQFGVQANQHKALFYFERLVLKGDAHGQFMAGHIYFGNIVGPLYKKAFDYFTAAALQNHMEAENFLGFMYLYNHGINPYLSVKDRIARGLSLLIRSSEHGFNQSSYELGKLYQKGSIEIPKDRTKALAYYKKALDQGHPKATEKLKLASLWLEEERLD